MTSHTHTHIHNTLLRHECRAGTRVIIDRRKKLNVNKRVQLTRLKRVGRSDAVNFFPLHAVRAGVYDYSDVREIFQWADRAARK